MIQTRTNPKVIDVMAAFMRAAKQAAHGFRYDRSIGRYRDRVTGRLVSEARVFDAAEGFREFTQSNIDDITKRLIGGQIDTAQWQRLVAQEIKDAHIVSASAGRGGRAAMTSADWGGVGGRLNFQYSHLNNLAAEWESGAVSEKQLAARARAYGASANESYNAGMMAGQREAGNNLIFSLGATEQHCSDCLRLDGQVHSADEWSDSPMRPQSSALECTGIHCDCRLSPTDERVRGGF